MSLARKYNSIVKRHLLHYVSWSPVVDQYAPGDFGAFRKGVFRRLGNVREFGVKPPQRQGNTAPFDFTSAGTVIVRTKAGVAVDVFPDQPVEAKLKVEFRGADCFYIKTAALTVHELESPDALATQLQGKRDANGRRWRLGWRVVHKVYVAVDPTILASSESNTTFELSGRADALRRLEIGSGSVDISVSASREDVVKIASGTGPVALDLFRVRLLGGAGLESAAEAEVDDTWPEDPDDDDDALFE